MSRAKLRAMFTRWMYRADIDPDGFHPVWRRIAMHYLFSYNLYQFICLHPVWVETKRRTDPIVWVSEALTGDKNEKSHGGLP